MLTVHEWTGREARALRLAKRLSVRAFAEHLGVAVRTVSKWEAHSTEITPRPDTQALLDTVLTRANADEQARFQRFLTDNGTPSASITLVDRSGKESHDAHAGHLNNWKSSETSEAAVPPGRRVDLTDITQLHEHVRKLTQDYDRHPSALLLAAAGQCHGQVIRLRERACDSRTRRHLWSMEAESAILMGQLVWDASQRRDHTTTLAYLDAAILAARQAQDAAAEAHALLRKSFVALYGTRLPDHGLALGEQTVKISRHISDVLTGQALLHIAEARAMRGEQQECEAALHAADTYLARVKPTDTAIGLYSPTQFNRLAGSCYLRLDRPDRAEALLTPIIDAVRAKKSAGIVLGNLALARIRQNRLEEAIAALHQAMDIAETTRGGGGLNVIFTAGRELRPWLDRPTVQETNDRLLALMTTT